MYVYIIYIHSHIISKINTSPSDFYDCYNLYVCDQSQLHSYILLTKLKSELQTGLSIYKSWQLSTDKTGCKRSSPHDSLPRNSSNILYSKKMMGIFELQLNRTWIMARFHKHEEQIEYSREVSSHLCSYPTSLNSRHILHIIERLKYIRHQLWTQSGEFTFERYCPLKSLWVNGGPLRSIFYHSSSFCLPQTTELNFCKIHRNMHY